MSFDLPVGWTLRDLGSLVDEPGVTYGVVQPGGPVADGVPMLRVNNFRDGGLASSDVLRIDPAVAAGFSRTSLKGGEVLITLVGTVGLVAVAPPTVKGWNVARAVGVIPVREELMAQWVARVLRAPAAVSHFGAHVNTTVQTTLNLRDLNALHIPIPPDSELKRIVRVIDALDQKIASNRSLADNVFATITSTFERDLRAASGDETQSLSSIASFTNGGAYTKYATGNGKPILRIREMNNGISSDTPRGEIDAPGSRIACSGDLLFSWSGTLLVQRWDHDEAYINQHIFKVESATYPLWYIECWLNTHLPWFRSLAADKATTMGHIQRGHLNEAQVHTDLPCLRENRATMDQLEALRNGLQKETRMLVALRDAMLPRLISGRLRVPDTLDVDEIVQPAAQLLQT